MELSQLNQAVEGLSVSGRGYLVKAAQAVSPLSDQFSKPLSPASIVRSLALYKKQGEKLDVLEHGEFGLDSVRREWVPLTDYISDGYVRVDKSTSNPVDVIPSAPHWVEFAGALASDPAVNGLVATAATAAPVLHLMLGVGMGQAAQGDSRTFLSAWSQAIAVGLVTTQMISGVQALAVQYGIPAEFIMALSPS